MEREHENIPLPEEDYSPSEQEQETQEPPRTDFWIPESRLQEFHEKLDKLNRRAAKIQVPLIRKEKLGEEMRPYTEYEGGKKIELFRKYEHWKVEGEAPKIADWAFVATLQHTAAGNILRVLPSFLEELPLRFRTLQPLCDHCGYNRRRNDTYIVRHDLSLEWKQVGRQCLKDFMGHQNPLVIAGWMETLLSLAQEFGSMEEELGGGGFQEKYFRTEGGVVLVRATISRHGWVSSSKAKAHNAALPEDSADFLESTSSIFSDLHYRPLMGKALKYWEERALPIFEAAKREDLIAEAKAALDWAQNLEGKTDFEWNLKVVASQEFYSRREMGLVCAIVGCYLNNLEKARREEAEKQASSASSWVGTPKKRQVFGPVTLISTKDVESVYGVSCLHYFQDAAGNRMKWFSTSGGGKMVWVPSQGQTFIPDFEIGGVYMIKATVKEHGEWKGTKETLMNRVVLESVVSYPEGSLTPLHIAANAAYEKEKAEKASSSPVPTF